MEEDESSLPSPPPVPSVVTFKKIPPSHNGNLSSTTATDEENEPPNGHRRNHSEGSRIGNSLSLSGRWPIKISLVSATELENTEGSSGLYL